jgi:multisubunit Na+/H+ antiporter MnhG subunit
MVLGAVAAFVIDREFNRAAIAAIAGAVFSFIVHSMSFHFVCDAFEERGL